MIVCVDWHWTRNPFAYSGVPRVSEMMFIALIFRTVVVHCAAAGNLMLIKRLCFGCSN